jgi:hypothetical protein
MRRWFGGIATTCPIVTDFKAVKTGESERLSQLLLAPLIAGRRRPRYFPRASAFGYPICGSERPIGRAADFWPAHAASLIPVSGSTTIA